MDVPYDIGRHPEVEPPDPKVDSLTKDPPPVPKHQDVRVSPTYKDIATWTVEDEMPSPMDSSTPVDSPDLNQLRHFKNFDQAVLPLSPPHPYLNSPTDPPLPPTVGGGSTPCFTVSSQLQSREARLYENVPQPAVGPKNIESLGLIFQPPFPSSHQSPHGGGDGQEFLSVSDFLNGGCCGGGGGGGSRSSWVDSGRESLSFDGESNTPNNSNSNNSNSSRTVVVTGGTGTGYYYPHDHSPSHSHQHLFQLRGSSESGRKSRRDRLVKQKHLEDFPSCSGTGTGTGPGTGGISSMCSYLAVPSPRRTVLSSGLASSVALAAASPISLHRQNTQQMVHENKKYRGLIPGAESPYTLGPGLAGLEDRKGHEGQGSFNDHVRVHRMSRSPSRSRTSGGSSKYKVKHSTGCARYKPDSFDYGELPSHQMFPKRHLLPSRQYSQPYTSSGVNPLPLSLHPSQNHRSFPANLLSNVAPRSCSLGDLSSAAGASSSNLNQTKVGHHGDYSHHVTIPPVTPQQPAPQHSSHMVASLPLPPATSVTYEFSLAPVHGTLAPGWNLTAVQRGLATAVPLAAAVARRRLPRPRPIRQRFGFTDKNEARRAKCTIAVTALGLLAMSMLLVGITLRLAPLIDDLDRRAAASFTNKAGRTQLSPTELGGVE